MAGMLDRNGLPSYQQQNDYTMNTLQQERNDASAARAQGAQNQITATQQQNDYALARKRAADAQVQMMGNSGNPQTSNGIEMQISNSGTAGGGNASGGAASSRAGVSIGGGAYPDISGLVSQFQNTLAQPVNPAAHVGAPLVPSTSGAFAHAKDVSGRVGNKAIEALRNGMTSRGISDSGMATQGEANILGNVARQQSDAEYQAANTDNTRQWQANQMAYEGDINQNQNAASFAASQKNQSLQAILALMNRLY